VELLAPHRKLSAFFFLYGGLIHFLLFRWFVSRGYPAGSETSFVNHPATNIAAVVLPGISVSWFMLLLLRQALRTDSNRASRIVLKGGFYGVLATILALEVFYVLCSFYIGLRASGEPFPVWLWAIPLAFIGIQTYGLEPIIDSIPFAFIYGAIGAAFILKIRERESHSTTAP